MFDVRRSPELQATIALLKQAPTRVRAAMKRRARVRMNELWRPGLTARASSRLQQQVIVKGARADVGNDMFRMIAATSRRPLSGGLVPDRQWHGAELGAHRLAQFPSRNPDGLVAFPTARDIGPELVAEWVDGAVEGAFEGTAAETVGG